MNQSDRRGKKPGPPVSDDLVRRDVTATAANELWLVDITEHRTRKGKLYLCAVKDVFSRRIVGYSISDSMKARIAVDAVNSAASRRGHVSGCIVHSDRGRQFTSIRYGERLAEIGAVPSIGTVCDSFDNALAETVNAYYKAELVRGPKHPGPRKTVEELERATLGWVHLHNQERLHGFIGDVPPAEYEETFYAEQRQAKVLAENTTLGTP